MKKTKLIRLLQKLSEAEKEDLTRFLHSPYFNSDPEITRLFTALVSNWPEHPGDKKVLFQQVFPGRPYDDKAFRYLTSQLNKRIERFLAIRAYEQNSHKADLDLLRAFTERHLEKEYQQTLRRLQHTMEQWPGRDASFFYSQMEIATVAERHFALQRRRTYDPALQQITDQLDRYYFLQKLKYNCAMLDRQHVIEGPYQPNLSSALIEYLQHQEYFDEPLIRIYFQVYMALNEEDETEYFESLRNSLLGSQEATTLEEWRDLFYFAINYCLRKIRQGKTDFLAEALTLYRTGIDRHILLDGGQLSPWTFTNVVKLALRLGKYEWIDAFINEFMHLLPEQFRSDALHYSLAERYYYTHDYNQAIEHLNQVRLSDLNYHLGSRVLLAKVYYEEGSEEPLLSLLAAFTMFLKRNKKVSKPLKKTYLNFCEALFRILKRRSGRWDSLETFIRETTMLTDRAWLLETLARERALNP
jgi:tetratricopeptide (TPR) repeat protein